MESKDHITIVIPQRLVFTGIAFVLLILLSFSALSAMDSSVWAVLKDISTDQTGSVSVDNNENGIIDNTDSCNGADVCEMRQLKMTAGTPGPTTVLMSDDEGLASWKTFSPSIPQHAVAFFEGTTCPDGWTELVAARGRYVVGLPAGGTVGGTVGTPLANLENRPIGAHSHAILDPGHRHGYTYPHIWIVTSIASGHNAMGAGAVDLSQSVYLTNAAVASMTIYEAGTGVGTNAPYLQMILCEKL